VVLDGPVRFYLYFAGSDGYANNYRNLLFNGKQHRFWLQPIYGIHYSGYCKCGPFFYRSYQ